LKIIKKIPPSISSHFQKDNKNLNAGFHVELNSPVINHYAFEAHIQKSAATPRDNRINVGFAMIDEGNENRFDADLIYRLDPRHVIDGHLAIASNIFPIERFNTSVFIAEGAKPKFDIQIRYSDELERSSDIKFVISREGNTFAGELVTPLREMSQVHFVGDLVEGRQAGVFKAKGKVFKDAAPFSFEGDVVMHKNFPSQADVVINTDGGDAVISYNLAFDEFKRSIKAKVSRNAEFVNFESELYVQDLLDWAYNVKIVSSREELNELMLSTMLSPHSKTQYEASFEMTSPWADHHIDRINISSIINLNNNYGDANLLYAISKHEGESKCAWKWQKQEYLFKVDLDSKDTGKHFNTEVSYASQPKAPTDVLFVIDINSIWK
jgi:hypothetical protein